MILETVNLTTIGFTKTTAENFFTRLAQSSVKRVIDVRLNNVSQLSGFAKAKDISFFLKTLNDIEYIHEPLLAPTQDILTSYKKLKGDWIVYEKSFLDLMDKRKIDERLSPDFFENGCLLCSEHEPHFCHRRLVADFLQDRWAMPIDVTHL